MIQIFLKDPTDTKHLARSISELTNLIQLYDSGKISHLKKADARLSISLVPNTERTVIEKAAIAKEIKLAKLEKMMDPSESDGAQDDDSISFEHDAGEIDEIDSMARVSQYCECIFGLRDLYVYRGVFSAYCGKYEEAVTDFIKVQDEKQLSDDQLSEQ